MCFWKKRKPQCSDCGNPGGALGPRTAVRGPGGAHVQKNLNSANEEARSQREGGRLGVPDCGSTGAPVRKKPGSVKRNVEGSLGRSSSRAESRANSAPPGQPRGRGKIVESQPEGGNPGVTPSSSDGACIRTNSSPPISNAESQPEDGEPEMASSSRGNARTRRNPDPAKKNAQSQREDDRPGIVDSGGVTASSREDPGSENRSTEGGPGRSSSRAGGRTNGGPLGQPKGRGKNVGSQPEGGKPGMAPSSSDGACIRTNPSPTTSSAGNRPGDGGLEMAPSSRGNARTRGNPDPANKNAQSQWEDDRQGIVDSGGAIAHSWEEPSSGDRSAEGSLGRSGSRAEGRTNGGPSSQPRGRGNPGGNPEDLQSHENVQATGESECQSQTGTDGPQKGKGRAPGVPGTAGALGIGDCAPGDSGSTVVRHDRSKGAWPRVGIPAEEENMSVSQIRTWPDTATTGYVYQRYSPDRPARPPDEEEGSTGNQIADEARDIFCSGPEPAMREEGRGTHDTDPINTSVELGSAEGSFRCNSGNQNNYGANNRKAVNEGTIVNQGTIVNLMGADGGDRLRITAVAAIEEAPQAPWMVTYCQNRGFTGREDILRRIEIRTQTGDHDRVALWGLGGTGKTQIALKYVYQYGRGCPVFWVHGSSLEKFSAEYTNIMPYTGISQTTIDGKDNESLLTLVKKWFESPSSGEWILVVDNADNESDFDGNTSPIARYIPRGPKGTLIVTTRSKLVASRLGCHGDNFIKVERMKPVEAKQLFLFRYGVLKRAGDERVVGDILRSLHYLPLAVVGAAAYMTETSTTPSQYYRMLKSKNAVRERLLSQEFNDIYREAPAGVAESILSTFFITFRQINERYHQAMDLLRLITFLKEHQNIPEDVLRCSGLTGMDDDFTVREIIGKLESFSLVTEKTASSVEDQSLPVYELHRLVQISAEVYFKKREGLDVSIWMGRARSAEELASRARLPPISSQGPQDQPDSEIEQPDQECV